MIRKVIIYRGHEKHPLFGPYPASVSERKEMFNMLNQYRVLDGRDPWKVETVSGEQLVSHLSKEDPTQTLLVIPAGQSSILDKVFDAFQTTFLKSFFNQGGRGYLNCGSAYWASRLRIYKDLCSEQPEFRGEIRKISQIPLFRGIAKGPLCPFPGKRYNVAFFSDTARISSGNLKCTALLSGGGSFINPEASGAKVVARYSREDLKRFKIPEEDFSIWENAAIAVPIRSRPSVLLAMFHPTYGPENIDVEGYTRAFPDSGTDWKQIRACLSPLDVRMRFMYEMLKHLEV